APHTPTGPSSETARRAAASFPCKTLLFLSFFSLSFPVSLWSPVSQRGLYPAGLHTNKAATPSANERELTQERLG
ncbi:unnamed protein product, partial [Ectocarpus sp. 4 AP-2014]